ncbi:DUF7674 family protein [Sphingobacterium sp. HJSM2_6]|uniref:DUF7674 family protein n=1 Tax=Sphingobacterium sp. HJSM2_6 TaxID=3366264 RepID=UPI003BDB3D18
MENITASEMAKYVRKHIRKLSPQLKQLKSTSEVPAILQVIVSYMRELCLRKNFRYVKRLLVCVSNLYEKGDLLIKQNIEYLFMHCLARMDHLCSINQWNSIINQLPWNLRKVYIVQHIK